MYSGACLHQQTNGISTVALFAVGPAIGYPQAHTCNSKKPLRHHILPFRYSLLLPEAENGFDRCRSKSPAKSHYMIVSCQCIWRRINGKPGTGGRGIERRWPKATVPDLPGSGTGATATTCSSAPSSSCLPVSGHTSSTTTVLCFDLLKLTYTLPILPLRSTAQTAQRRPADPLYSPRIADIILKRPCYQHQADARAAVYCHSSCLKLSQRVCPVLFVASTCSINMGS